MPRAVPPATRQDVIERHLRGQTLPQIAAELGIPFDTVRDLWRAFRDGGPDGLATGYHACGSATPTYSEAVLRRACRLKREHSGWGPGGSEWNSLNPSARTTSPRRGSCNGPSCGPVSTARAVPSDPGRRCGGPRPPRDLAGGRGREGTAEERGRSQLAVGHRRVHGGDARQRDFPPRVSGSRSPPARLGSCSAACFSAGGCRRGCRSTTAILGG